MIILSPHFQIETYIFFIIECKFVYLANFVKSLSFLIWAKINQYYK